MLLNIRHDLKKTIVPFFICLIFCHFLLYPHSIFAQQYQSTIDDQKKDIIAQELFADINVQQLIALANSKKLSQSKKWWALLHYKKNISGIKSLVDDPKFFLAPDGKYNPESELEATIRFLYSYNDKENPVCRFMARYSWLKKELGAVSPHETHCEKLQEIISFKDDMSVHLIFPTGYINSPASMFGHTLLTVQSQYNPGLLSSAVNYAANTNETFGPSFAFKGIFGLYRGYFSIQPYYSKVQEYSDLESRDIWEYKLNLNQDEVRMMLFHIWELDNIYSDYYFFDENCSYNLLYLLEVTRPDTHLTDNFFFWVIPIDTLRKVSNAGFIENKAFRPSRTTLIQYLVDHLNKQQINAIKSIAKGNNPLDVINHYSFNDLEKVQVLDCASEYIQYCYADKQYSQKEYQTIFINVLKLRSTLTNTITYSPPAPPPPEDGHYSSRINIQMGSFENDSFTELSYRPSYHDLCDDTSGFVSGSQIIFGEIAARYYWDTQKIQFQRFDIIDIESIAPINPLIKPLSWKIITGFERLPFENNNELLVYQLNTGGGYAFSLTHWFQLYGMVEFSGLLHNDFENNIEVAPGASIGLLLQPFNKMRLRFHVNDCYYMFGESFNYITIKTIAQYNINQRFSFRFDVNYWHHEQWYHQFSGSFIYYFW